MQLSVECIDLGHEESASMLDQPVDDARAWVAADVDSLVEGSLDLADHVAEDAREIARKARKNANQVRQE